jgi:AAA domain-containing protein
MADDLRLAVPEGWLRQAKDLISQPDLAPTPMLVDGLVVDEALTVLPAPFKVGKTWVGLELVFAVTGARPAFDLFEASEPGAVLAIFEESGEAALHRRLRALQKGYEIDERSFKRAMRKLCFAANAGVQLTDPDWQEALIEATAQIDDLRLILLDPFARMKGDADENRQDEIAPILTFLRELRNEAGAAVVLIHHTGHDGNRSRGTSDIEAYWESRIRIEGSPASGGPFTLRADHREAETTVELRYQIAGSSEERWVRLDPLAVATPPTEKRRDEQLAYIEENPGHTTEELAGSLHCNENRLRKELQHLAQEGLVYSSSPGSPDHPSEGHKGHRRSNKRKEWFSASAKPNSTPPDVPEDIGGHPKSSDPSRAYKARGRGRAPGKGKKSATKVRRPMRKRKKS